MTGAAGAGAGTAGGSGSRDGRVLVIGAGLAGLAAATALAGEGREVIVVDRGRGPGGRMSTRRHGGLRFDHGAQYFTARDARFVEVVGGWASEGLIGRWEPRLAVVEAGELVGKRRNRTERWVGVPGMNAVARSLAGTLPDCRFGWTARQLHWSGPGPDAHWRAVSEDGETLQAQALIVAAPPAQAVALLSGTPLEDAVRDVCAGVQMLPCWALMAQFDWPLFAHFDALFVNSGPISWIAAQASKPGRDDGCAWVVHASPEWSARALEWPAERVAQALIEAALALPGASQARVIEAVAHRWRHALAREPLTDGALSFDACRLALAGDWCCGSRVEGAWLSGMTAARRISGA